MFRLRIPLLLVIRYLYIAKPNTTCKEATLGLVAGTQLASRTGRFRDLLSDVV